MLTPEDDTFDKIEKNNPYKIEAEKDEERMLSEDLVRQAFRLQRKAYLVKFLAIIDFVSNILYGYYGYFLYIIFAACTLSGYLSTINYNRTLLFWYLVYQIIQIVFKGTSFIFVIALGCSSNFRHEIANHTNSTDTLGNFDDINYGIMIPVTGLLLIVQIFITTFIYDFYKCLPTRQEVRQLLV